VLADQNLRTELERVASYRIFFGHQSVGGNILYGVSQLAERSGVFIRVEELLDGKRLEQAVLWHLPLEENGKPMKKFASFEHTLEGLAAPIDVALMKLCYIDFTGDTDATKLFADYRSTIDRLKAKYPQIIFVHVTAPLTEIESGAKASVKRLIGRPPYGVLENIRRHTYNELLRQAYAGREPIFDLARIESTTPEGQPILSEWQGSKVPTLARQYTSDGGHLNEVGSLRAAREFISVLSSAKRHPPIRKGTQ